MSYQELLRVGEQMKEVGRGSFQQQTKKKSTATLELAITILILSVDPSRYKKKATVDEISISAEILGTILDVFERLIRDKKKQANRLKAVHGRSSLEPTSQVYLGCCVRDRVSSVQESVGICRTRHQ
jgi:hypothetical protein